MSQVAHVEPQHHDGRESDVRLGLAWLVRVRYHRDGTADVSVTPLDA